MCTEPTAEGRTMETEERIRLDKNAIQVLNLPRMLALILKKCYPDSFYGSLESIESRFRKELTRADDKHLRSELTNTESKNVTTGVMRFDSIFLTLTEVKPGAYLVNVEVQNRRISFVWFAGRVYAYLSRMLDSQKDDISGYRNDHYQDLKPVMALWILPHEQETYLIDYPGIANLCLGQDTLTGQDMKRALDGFVRYKIVGLGPDWMDYEEEAVQCLGHIFRSDDDKKKQYDYLEKEGIPMTERTEKVLDEYGEAQFQWFHRSEKEKYDRLKEEMDAQLKESDMKLKESDMKLKEKNQEVQRLQEEIARLKALSAQL